jgi:DNA-binding Xre family transcriptional regulator
MQEKFNIGALIQKRMEENGQKERWLAEKMCCSKSKISYICQGDSINTRTLILICIYLNYNFFDDYVNYVNKYIEEENSFLLPQFVMNEIHIGKIIRKVTATLTMYRGLAPLA